MEPGESNAVSKEVDGQEESCKNEETQGSTGSQDQATKEILDSKPLRQTQLNKDLYDAVEEADFSRTVELLAKGADPNQSQQWDGYDIDRPLHAAARGGDLSLVRLLLKNDCHVDLLNGCRQTALHIAAQNEKLDIAQELVLAEANIDAADDLGRTALILGCKNVHMTELLIKSGCMVNARDMFGFTALLDAAASGNVESAGKLITAGTDPNQSDLEGYTPLMMAAKWGYARMVDFLVGAGSCPVARASSGVTALHEAAAMDCRGTPDILRSLLNAGCDPDLANGRGQTPLVCAVELGRYKNTRILIGANCQVNYTFPMFANSYTPLQLSFLAAGELVKLGGRNMRLTSPERKDLDDQLRIMSMLVMAGASVREAMLGFESTVERISQCALNNLKSERRHTISVMKDSINHPRSLAEYCRLLVRNICGRSLPQAVRTWPIPPFLQDYILLAELEDL